MKGKTENATQPQVRMKIEYVREIETDELDFVVYDVVLGKKWEEKERGKEIVSGEKGKNWCGEADLIPIGMVRHILEELEKKGAECVEIMNHRNHRSYVFNGAKVSRASDGECESESNREMKKREIEIEINSLYEKLEELREVYHQI